MDTGLAARLAEPFILALLRRGPSHGYALLKELDQAFGEGAVAKARVYQLLRRLQGDGLVEEANGDGNRKAYRLTDEGEAQLDAMADQNEAFQRLLGELFSLDRVPEAMGTPGGPIGSAPSCPGCEGLSMQLGRTLNQGELVIRMRRGEKDKPHRPDCTVAALVRHLSESMMP